MCYLTAAELALQTTWGQAVLQIGKHWWHSSITYTWVHTWTW